MIGHQDEERKVIPGRRNSMCKGFKAGKTLCSRNAGTGGRGRERRPETVRGQREGGGDHSGTESEEP